MPNFGMYSFAVCIVGLKQCNQEKNKQCSILGPSPPAGPGLGRRKLNWSLLNLAEPNFSHYNQLATLFDINLLLCPMSSLWTRIRQKFLLHPTDSRHNWLGCKYVNMNRIKRFGRMIRFGLFFSPPTFFTTSMILYMDTSDAWLGW